VKREGNPQSRIKALLDEVLAQLKRET